MPRGDDDLPDLGVVPRPPDRPLPPLGPALRPPGKCPPRGPVWGAGGAGRLRSAGGAGRLRPTARIRAGAARLWLLEPAQRLTLPTTPYSILLARWAQPAAVWPEGFRLLPERTRGRAPRAPPPGGDARGP